MTDTGKELEPDVISLAAAVDALRQLDAAALQRRWRSLIGGLIPPDLGRPLALRVLAYKLQAQRLGDLDGTSRRELAALTSGASVNSERAADGIGSSLSAPAVGAKDRLPQSLDHLGGTTILVIAERESRSPRMIRMMLSLAFLDPRLVRAVLHGDLPRGVSTRKMVDAPALWHEQWQAIGLSRPT